MKTFDVYGVEMTSLQEMKFSLWLNSSGIAMNTKYPDERKQIAIDWLNENSQVQDIQE